MDTLSVNECQWPAMPLQSKQNTTFADRQQKAAAALIRDS